MHSVFKVQKKYQNERAVGSSYFKNLKESVDFMEELLMALCVAISCFQRLGNYGYISELVLLIFWRTMVMNSKSHLYI